MRLTVRLLLTLAILFSASCGGGGGGGDSGGDASLSRNTCGVIGLNSRIITGTECSQANSPVVEISITFQNGTSGVCSGTMIASQWVLTAAHCFFESPSSVNVSAAGVSAKGSDVFLNPDVRIDQNDQSVANDVAVIKLTRSLPLPTLAIVGSRAPVSGDLIDIYGYGLSENESPTNSTVGTLRSGQMQISDVSSRYIDAFYNGNGSNTCSGDSGGPAILDIGGQIGIVGITSTGSLEACEKGDTSRFTNLQESSNFNFLTRTVPDLKVL